MQVIVVLLALFFVDTAFAHEAPKDDKPTKQTYKIAKQFGYNDRLEIDQASREAKKNLDVDAINKELKGVFKDRIQTAIKADEALEGLLRRADTVLRHMGHDKLADDTFYEYMMFYRGYFQRFAWGYKEIGDHEPMSEWLDNLHKKIEDAVGEVLCEFFHFHDLYIFNYAIPVMLEPEAYDLKEYKDHFSGHLIWGWYWEHHGGAGVITYWTVEIACTVMTNGLGIIPFVCSPIAGFAEHIMDKSIAPPIATWIWERSNQDQNDVFR